MMVDNVYILDNGAHTAKVELSKAVSPRIIPNCIMKAKSERRRPFIADQVDECRDASGLFYLLPFQKGFLINWDVQKTVWDYIFSKECCYGNFSETPLIVTEPYFNFPSIQEAMSEIFFEEYDCQSLLRINANCSVKEELQQYIEILQFHHKIKTNLDFLVSSGYLLRFMSSKVTCEDMKVIFWKENRNPLLYQNFLKDYCTGAIQSFKQLWRSKVYNLPDETFLSELALVPSLHHHLHVKRRKHGLGLVDLSDFDVSDSLAAHENVCRSNIGRNFSQNLLCCNVECTSSHCDIHTRIIKNITDPMIKKMFDLENFDDLNDQPINYSYKYFEYDYPTVIDNVEKPVDYSLKYFDETESECADMMMFGAGEMCYAETDLDHSPDIYSCLEKENSNFRQINDCPVKIDESLSGIPSQLLVEDEILQTAKVSETLDSNACTNLKENVDKKNEVVLLETPEVVLLETLEVVLLETPLVFSRSSSVSSLTSVEPIDDVTSVISDYSRVASGMISPSDLPDSPTQTSAPSILSYIHAAPQKLRSVFEEKVSIFREESTPVQFSCTSSLSGLTFDDNQQIPVQNQSQSVIASEVSSNNGEDDEDILAACINAGMQNVKSRNVGNTRSRKKDEIRPVNELSSASKILEKNDCLISVFDSKSKSESSALDIQTITTDNTTLNISSPMCYADFSGMADDLDRNDMLVECIQTGMPKAPGRTKCKYKKTPKVSLKLSMPKNKSLQRADLYGPSSSSDNFKTANNARLIPETSVKVQSNSLNPELYCSGLLKASEALEKSLLNSPLESNVQLSRRSSIDSTKEDFTEDQVTLSELLLLEQCITSGMPKKKTR